VDGGRSTETTSHQLWRQLLHHDASRFASELKQQASVISAQRQNSETSVGTCTVALVVVVVVRAWWSNLRENGNGQSRFILMQRTTLGQSEPNLPTSALGEGYRESFRVEHHGRGVYSMVGA